MVEARTLVAGMALLAAALSGCQSIPQGGVARGEVLYKNCVQCHGDQGQGSPLIPAPQIAGLPAWYVEAQVLHFQNGMRGAHPDDISGLRMRPMSRTLKSDADVKVVAEYVASLPHQKTPMTVQGDAAKGQASYGTCSACHGADGAGNEAMKAPPIRQLDDWYLVAQLAKFKAGQRGYHADDTAGAQMRGIAAGLADEQVMRDLAAYIHTLPSK